MEDYFCCRRRKNYDVILIAKEDGTKIKAHRSILSDSSEYFRAMFSSGFKEETTADVEISGISGKELKAIIKYSYTENIVINENNVEKLLPNASLMLYEDIVKKCEYFILCHLSTSNCFTWAFFAELYNCPALLYAIKTYQIQHFHLILFQEEILNLSAEELYRFLSVRKINVDDNNYYRVWTDVFKGIMRWIEHDSRNREQFLPKALDAARLKLIESKYLLENDEECAKLINKVLEDTAALNGKNFSGRLNDSLYLYEFKNNSIEIFTFFDSSFNHGAYETKFIIVSKVNYIKYYDIKSVYFAILLETNQNMTLEWEKRLITLLKEFIYNKKQEVTCPKRRKKKTMNRNKEFIYVILRL